MNEAMNEARKPMNISTEYSNNNKTMNIVVHGRFDFKMVGEFREAYSAASKTIEHFVIDFRETDYMDSSGLGMLLNLKRQVSDDTPITLTNCKPQIKKILLVSRFDKKFTIQ